MNAQAKPAEPSMEEILASIRRIIADDEVKPAEDKAPDPPAAEVQARPVSADLADPDDDVLDLGAEASLIAPAPTPVAAPAAPTAPPPPPPAIAADPIFEAELDVDFLETPEPVAAPQRAPEVAAAPQMLASHAAALDMTQLLSDQTSHAVHNAFGQLAHTVLSNNARTLEDLVKDMLKPMLKTWLDDNLPVMVERLVRAEIERVARGGRS